MPIDEIINALLKRMQVRAKSMVVTVFGDSIVPRGGEVWLADLIRLMAPFQINDRMVRTAVYRLTQDGYFKTARQGRQSLYLLTDEGRRIFASAERRIYAAEPPSDTAGWTLLYLTGGLSPDVRKSLGKLLGWQGFAELSPNVFASCTVELADLNETLEGAAATDQVAAFLAAPIAERADAPAMRRLVAEAWPLEDLAAQYQAFEDLLQPIDQLLKDGTPVSPEQAFLMRSIAVHAYRRLLLRHPTLPGSLVPENWPGEAAMRTYEAVYGGLLTASERHLAATMETLGASTGGTLLARRFGGRVMSPGTQTAPP